MKQNRNSDKKKVSGRISYTKKVSGPNTKPVQDNTIRLNKYIASTGFCSRREADKYIADGLIKVNGKVITELGTKISPGVTVKFGGEILIKEKLVYILVNKPKDFVTTTDDPKERKTVLELVKNACSERIYPVGRLDKKTTGVLLLTNDGELTTRLTHPKYNRKKIYHIFLDKSLTIKDMAQIADGVNLEDGLAFADKISYVNEKDKTQLGMEIHSGKNRIIRRIFEHLGYKVIKLDRVWFAGLTKKNLKRGQWRFLTRSEVEILKRGQGK